MSKKPDIDTLIFITIISLGIIAIFYLLTLQINDFLKPQYNITVQECWNETNDNLLEACLLAEVTMANSIKDYNIDKSTIINCLDKVEQRCQTKEVQEIEFCDEPPCGYGECSKLCDSEDRNMFIVKIDVKDINIDFINSHLNNFKCIEGNYSGGYYNKDNLCSKYKICDYEGKCYNKYTIEVIK